MKQNKALQDQISDYDKVRIEISKMKKDKINMERGEQLLKTKLHPFFKKFKKLLPTNPDQLEKISPLSAGTFHKLFNGENIELYSMIIATDILFYSKGYELCLANGFNALRGIRQRGNRIVIRVIPVSKLSMYATSTHLYVPITEGKASPLYPDRELTEAKRTVMKKHSKKRVAATMHAYLGPYAVKCHKLAEIKVFQLEETDGHNHTTISNLHQGRNIQMDNYLSIFDTYYRHIGVELSYPNLSNAILKATKNGTCVVMQEVPRTDQDKYRTTDFLYSYLG